MASRGTCGGALLLRGMLQELPAPGSYWPHEDRATWLDAMGACLRWMYSDVPPVVPATAPQPPHLGGVMSKLGGLATHETHHN